MQKNKLISEIRQQIIAIYTLPNSSSKGNQAMKFGQFIKSNVINIFL